MIDAREFALSTISFKQYRPGSIEWSRWSVLCARIACVLLILLLMWQVVRLVLLMLSGPEVELDIPAARQLGSRPAAAPVDIAGWHLFGRATVSNPLNLSALPETPLDLQLRGIVSGMKSDQEGHAIIVDGRGGQWVYKVGDSVPGDATVRAITPDQVILERNGQNETLSLPQLLAGSSAAATARSAQNVRPGNLINAAPTQLRGLRGQPGIAPAISAPVGSISGAQLDTANLARLSQSVQVTPVNGGFKVFPGRNAAVFRQLGLHANDVITAVNGQPLSNVQAAMQIFQNLDNTSAITLSVRRGGQVVQLQPDMGSLRGQ